LVSVACGIRHARQVRDDIVPADGQDVDVAGGLLVGVGHADLALVRLWARVIALHVQRPRRLGTGLKRCHLHQPATGRQRSRCVVRSDRDRHPVLDNIGVRLRNDPLHVASAGTGEIGHGHSGGEDQFVGLARHQ
jgi:hypothetical protein